ncbi:MAG: ABC transporter transmembrane domain-containing protein [Myxococcota bacterium]|nr:ABC transporter transmembrane domain-containing protein [Myxococcota bacterium]
MDSSKTTRSTRDMLHRLVGLAVPEWRSLALGTVFLLIGSAMGLSYPQAIRVIVDEALGARDPAMVDMAVIAMLVIFGVQAVAVSLRYYLFTVAGERIVTRLRDHLFRGILAQEVGFFDQRRTGELTNRLSADTGVLQNTVSVNISMGLRFVASIVGGVGLLLYTSASLTLLMLLVVPPVAIGAVVVGRRIRKLSRMGQDALAKAGEVAEESISGVRTVRAFGREDHASAFYGEAVEHAFSIARDRARAVSVFMGAASFAGYSAVAVVLWFGGKKVLADAMTVGDLTSFILYTLIVAFSLGGLGGLWTDFMRAVGAADRVFGLLERTSSIPNSGGLEPQSAQGALRLEDVSFSYPSRPDIEVLHRINLELRPGKVVALVGPSGSGKSTIAALLSRLYDPVSGAVYFDDTPLPDLDPTWLRNQVGAVAQEPILFSTSIADNIRYGDLQATDEAVQRAATIANAHAFIEGFSEGYDTLVGERGVQLSGGQKQRVAIARAVLKDPALLILDEATSALDTESEHLVQEALERLMEGRTTLVIAHRLSTVQGADLVVVLDDGKIAEQGTHDELLGQGGVYGKLVERQLQGFQAA